MKINTEIFRAYDIRGKYPEEINKGAAFKIGWALVQFIRKRKKIRKIDILIGQDNRPSSHILFKGISQGVMSAGGNVVSLGVCTAPMFYFASQYHKFDDAGIMITASHLSKGYNGFKLTTETPTPLDSHSGLEKIEKMTINKIITQEQLKSFKKGKISKMNILKEYIKFNLKKLNVKKISPFKVVIDTGNAPSGIVMAEIFRKTKCKIFHLFPELNSNFPNRPLDCTKEKNLKKLRKEILKRKADLGIAFDGDGDRITFLDEKGKFVFPAFITALLARILLKKHPGGKIIYTPNQSRVVPETIKEMGGKAFLGKVGHSNIKQKMKRENILFGGEASAHYYLKSHYFCESPIFVLFSVLEELTRTKRKLSELIKPLQKYFYSGEINLRIKVKNKNRVFKTLEQKFKSGKILKIDGLRVDFPDWWFNIRPSHTEPVLRLVVEAKTKRLMKEKKAKIIKLIPSVF